MGQYLTMSYSEGYEDYSKDQAWWKDQSWWNEQSRDGWESSPGYCGNETEQAYRSSGYDNRGMGSSHNIKRKSFFLLAWRREMRERQG